MAEFAALGKAGELGPRPVRRESVLFFLLSVTVLCQ
jgi:hypothetical protein